MRPSRRKNCNDGCPVEAALDVIGNKWKRVILFHLLSGTKRFNELRRLIPDVTQRMMTLQLRELEADNIIIRTVYPKVPPHVDYKLTNFGQELEPIIFLLKEWGEKVIQQGN
ncbi:MAG: helix-turn-helix domain-containing protein [Burkholderiales bacterium]|nr:helix-turn-helix domain-containing protein [Burkholderiales bacterium]